MCVTRFHYHTFNSRFGFKKSNVYTSVSPDEFLILRNVAKVKPQGHPETSEPCCLHLPWIWYEWCWRHGGWGVNKKRKTADYDQQGASPRQAEGPETLLCSSFACVLIFRCITPEIFGRSNTGKCLPYLLFTLSLGLCKPVFAFATQAVVGKPKEGRKTHQVHNKVSWLWGGVCVWVGGRVRVELLADLGGPLTLPLHKNKGDCSRMLHWDLRVNSWVLHKYIEQINTKLLFSHCGHQGTDLTTASLITPSTYPPIDCQGV